MHDVDLGMIVVLLLLIGFGPMFLMCLGMFWSMLWGDWDV